MSIPDGWFIASEESEQFLRETGEDTLTSSDATLKGAVEASKKTTFQLLTLSEFEMGAAVEFNPILVLMAERISHMPGIKSGKDYLFHTNQLLSRVQLSYEVRKEAHPIEVGGQEWYRTDYLVNRPQVPIEQSYLATIHGDFALVVILSAVTREQMDALEQIAESITL